MEKGAAAAAAEEEEEEEEEEDDDDGDEVDGVFSKPSIGREGGLISDGSNVTNVGLF